MARAVRFAVTGHVQGVSFRACAAQEAVRLEVAGWVANESDGSVVGQVEGDDQAVQEMVRWCRTGSPAARVEAVDVHEVEPMGATSFEVRH